MAEPTTLSNLGEALGTAAIQAQAATAPPKPKLDAKGRAYATGRRKNAIARVWVKRGAGKITVNGKAINIYFARPVLQMLVQQPMVTALRRDQVDVDDEEVRLPFGAQLERFVDVGGGLGDVDAVIQRQSERLTERLVGNDKHAGGAVDGRPRQGRRRTLRHWRGLQARTVTPVSDLSVLPA